MMKLLLAFIAFYSCLGQTYITKITANSSDTTCQLYITTIQPAQITTTQSIQLSLINSKTPGTIVANEIGFTLFGVWTSGATFTSTAINPTLVDGSVDLVAGTVDLAPTVNSSSVNVNEYNWVVDVKAQEMNDFWWLYKKDQSITVIVHKGGAAGLALPTTNANLANYDTSFLNVDLSECEAAATASATFLSWLTGIWAATLFL